MFSTGWVSWWQEFVLYAQFERERCNPVQFIVRSIIAKSYCSRPDSAISDNTNIAG